jgi:hypothetical protein
MQIPSFAELQFWVDVFLSACLIVVATSLIYKPYMLRVELRGAADSLRSVMSHQRELIGAVNRAFDRIERIEAWQADTRAQRSTQRQTLDRRSAVAMGFAVPGIVLLYHGLHCSRHHHCV